LRADVDARRRVRALARAPLRLSLLNGFALERNDGPIEIPLSSQRVVAFLALHEQPLERIFVAGSLWLDATEAHAAACLRTALWRLRRAGAGGLVRARGTKVALSPEIDVDLADLARRTRRLLCGGSPEEDDLSILTAYGEILPDWYEDWALIERERFRQLRLNALEELCALLTTDGRMREAVVAGMAAVAGEPLRESAHDVLIRAHLAAGNVGEALRQFRFYRTLLRDELGLSPSRRLGALLGEAAARDV
jgi:DNA-binding SARP family transcriptional activator